MSIKDNLSIVGTTVALVGVFGLVAVVRQGSVVGPSAPQPMTATHTPIAVAAVATAAPTLEVQQPQAIGQVAKARDCVGHVTSWEGIVPTTRNMTGAADTVVVGTIESVDLPRWNTADGAAPADGNVVRADLVYRNVTVKIGSTLKGSAKGSTQLRVPGGRAGCEEFRYEGIPLDIEVGQQFAFFVQDLSALDANDALLPTVTTVWPASAGIVETPEDGKLSPAQLGVLINGDAAP